MGIKRFIASQLRQPHGWFGSLVMSRMLDRLNRQIVDRTLELLQLSPQQQVLEIGFGGGYALARLGRILTGGLATGIDVSAEMVGRAQSRFVREIVAGRVRVQLADVSRLPFPDAAFDRVLTINTIYFWPDALAGLREIRRVLKPNGLAAVSIRSKERMERSALIRYGHFVRLFSPEDLADLMQQAGFRDVHVDHRHQGKTWDQVVAVGGRG